MCGRAAGEEGGQGLGVGPEGMTLAGAGEVTDGAGPEGMAVEGAGEVTALEGVG